MAMCMAPIRTGWTPQGKVSWRSPWYLRPMTLALFAACSPSFDDSGALPTCDIDVMETLPADGSTQAYYRGPFEFVLEQAVPTAEVIADFPGEQGLRKEGTVITFAPDPPLEPLTDYTLGLDYCHGKPEITFKTSELGLPIEDEDSLVGRTYAVDLTSGDFLESDLVGTVLTGFFGRNVLVQIVDRADGDITFRAAISQAGSSGRLEQDTCSRSQDLDLDSTELPFVQLELEEFSFGAYEGSMTFYHFALDGTISPDASWIGGLAWTITVSADDLVPILEAPDVETVCETAANLEAECVPCPSGDDLCITVSGHRVVADAVEGDLEDITESGTHPECDEEAE